MMVVGFIAAFGAGVVMPSISIMMGSVAGTFDPSNKNNIDEIMYSLLGRILIVAAVLWMLGYIYYAFF